MDFPPTRYVYTICTNFTRTYITKCHKNSRWQMGIGNGNWELAFGNEMRIGLGR